MMQNRRLLISSLTMIGAISGFILGELFLGRGMGVYVSLVSALVGGLLAWALWHTRPRVTDATSVAPEAPRPPARQAPRRVGNVRVTKSQQGGKQR